MVQSWLDGVARNGLCTKKIAISLASSGCELLTWQQLPG